MYCMCQPIQNLGQNPSLVTFGWGEIKISMPDKLDEDTITTTVPFEQSPQSASRSGEAKAKPNVSVERDHDCCAFLRLRRL